MKAKTEEKEKAVQLRKQGKTYNEILEKIPVAKSTLSLWLRDVGLTKIQKQKVTSKRYAAQLRGAHQRRDNRIKETHKIYKNAFKDVGSLSKRERFLIGVTLYWTEGSKAKTPYNLSQGVDFINSDPHMIDFFVLWLIENLGVKKEDMRFSLYIHKQSKKRMNNVYAYWEKHTRLSKDDISYVYFKKHKIKTTRKNTNDRYYGSIRLTVRASTNLNRRIQGWIYGIIGGDQNCPVV